jgi:hypothetical protein
MREARLKRMVGRRCAFLGILTFLAVLDGYAPTVTAAPGVGARSAKRCPSLSGHVIAADAQAEIYLRPAGRYDGHYDGEEVVGCAYAKGHVYELGAPLRGDANGSGGITLESVVGHMAIFEDTASGESLSIQHVFVVDLLDDTIIRRVPSGTAPGQEEGIGMLVTLVGKPDGAVAWIVKAPEQLGTYQVHAVDSKGSRLLASGAGIAPSSLAIAGDTLYWMENDEPQSAPLE